MLTSPPSNHQVSCQCHQPSFRCESEKNWSCHVINILTDDNKTHVTYQFGKIVTSIYHTRGSILEHIFPKNLSDNQKQKQKLTLFLSKVGYITNKK